MVDIIRCEFSSGICAGMMAIYSYTDTRMSEIFFTGHNYHEKV